MTERLIRLAKMLCNPDPEKRGHPRENKVGTNRYRLNRIVSELNLISKHVRAEIYAR